jgi:hypothetical protein
MASTIMPIDFAYFLVITYKNFFMPVWQETISGYISVDSNAVNLKYNLVKLKGGMLFVDGYSSDLFNQIIDKALRYLLLQSSNAELEPLILFLNDKAKSNRSGLKQVYFENSEKHLILIVLENRLIAFKGEVEKKWPSSASKKTFTNISFNPLNTVIPKIKQSDTVALSKNERRIIMSCINGNALFSSGHQFCEFTDPVERGNNLKLDIDFKKAAKSILAKVEDKKAKSS